MPNKDCEDCKGTGLIMTETIYLSRPRYSKEHGIVIYDAIGDNNWKETICHCLDDE